jgi:nucleotide-binding universal stress UspA family protein
MNNRPLTQRILVPLDGSAVSTVTIPFLRTVATQESEVVLVRAVYWRLHLSDGSGAAMFDDEDLLREPRGVAAAYLNAVADDLQAITTNITKLSPVGMPADEILKISEELEASLIIMATHGRGVLGRALIGSIADRVARASQVPVLLIHPETEDVPASVEDAALIRRLVVPLDGSDRARAALPVASELASQLGVPVHLVSAVPTAEMIFGSPRAIPTGSGFERSIFAASARQLSERERDYHRGLSVSAERKLELDTGQLRAGDIETTTEVVFGDAVSSILGVLRPGDLIVMTSHGEGGIRRWRLGSIAEKLIHRAAAPIVLVPDPER